MILREYSREGHVALSVGHPRGTHSRYVIGCCLIPLGICGLKNNSRRITYGIGCVLRMPSLSPLSSLRAQRRERNPNLPLSLLSSPSKNSPLLTPKEGLML